MPVLKGSLSHILRLHFDDKMAYCAIMVPQLMLWRVHIGLFIFKVAKIIKTALSSWLEEFYGVLVKSL